MQKDDFERFRDLMRGMGRVYGQEIDAVILDAYWIALRDWALPDFEDAAAHLLRTAKFMPRPADFHELRQSTRPTAGEAWLSAPGSQDPLIQRALHAATQGRYYGHIPLDELQWVQKRFVEFYEQMREVDDVRAALPHYQPVRKLNGSGGFKQIGHDLDDE